LSDVAALQEIADESGAAQTFRAGYPRDLGRKLARLIQDPQHRRDLGVRGARWVRSQRTWDRNVSEYFRVYRELGYRGTVDDALRAQAKDHASAGAPARRRDPRPAHG